MDRMSQKTQNMRDVQIDGLRRVNLGPLLTTFVKPSGALRIEFYRPQRSVDENDGNAVAITN